MMGLTIELSKEKEEKLARRASKLGMSANKLVEQLVEVELQCETESKTIPEIKTGAELVEYWDKHGLFGSRPDIEDSLEHAREIRRQAERRGRA